MNAKVNKLESDFEKGQAAYYSYKKIRFPSSSPITSTITVAVKLAKELKKL